MTNREALIHTLSEDDFIDDGGASDEANIYYYIACPYRGRDERALCKDSEHLTREQCVECRLQWLDSEVDE